MPLSKYIPICDAITLLMDPLVEVVIHEIKSDSIVYIQGKLSNRKAGDPSLLQKNSLNDLDKIIYPKINFDGRLIKSISVKLENKWVLCINCDVSVFGAMQELGKNFLKTQEDAKPKSLFANDWQEKLNITIHEYLQEHDISFEHLNNSNKKTLIKHLFDLGAFNEKNAADYVAKALNASRGTIFNHLRNLRKK